MPFRILHAALIHEHRGELTLLVENIRQLLRDPPGVLAAAATLHHRAVIVIAAADPIHPGRIDHVAILIEDCAIAATIRRYLAMAVKFSPDDMQRTLGAL